MNTIRFYRILTVILLLVNLATMFFMWNTTKKMHPERPLKKLSEVLNLDGKVKVKTDELETKHFMEKNALVDYGFELHEKYFESIGNPAKKSETGLYLNQILQNQKKIEKITYSYFETISEFCNPSQKEKLKMVIHDMLQKTNRPPRP